MAKVISKGTTLKQTISASLTAVAQVISLDHSGAKSLTYESSTLDQTGPFNLKDLTGYSDPGAISGELFYDPNLAGHKFLTGLMGYATTAPAQNAMSLTFVDGGTTVMSFTAASVGFGVTVDMGSGLKGKFDIEVTGDPGFSHP